MKYPNNSILIVIIVATLQACISSPKCPEIACKVKFEHYHDGEVYRGKGNWLQQKRNWPWKKKSSTSQKEGTATKADPKKKKKYDKVFEWERQ
jgi:hypothetical protein